MEIITEIADYETADLDLKINGEAVTIVVRSMASEEFKAAGARHYRLIEAAKSKGTALTESIDIGFGIEEETQTEYARKLNAILIASLVVEWPYDERVEESILNNPSLGEAIEIKAYELREGFLNEKKT